MSAESLNLFSPSKSARVLAAEVQKIKKAFRIFNVTDHVSDVRSLGEHRIDGFNQFIFVREDTLLGLCVTAAAICPKLDASNVAAATIGFIMHAA